MVLSSFGFLRTVLAAGVAVFIGITSLSASEKGTPMTYGEARDFLAKHTKVVELKDERRRGGGGYARLSRPRDDFELRRRQGCLVRLHQFQLHQRRQD